MLRAIRAKTENGQLQEQYRMHRLIIQIPKLEGNYSITIAIEPPSLGSLEHIFHLAINSFPCVY